MIRWIGGITVVVGAVLMVVGYQTWVGWWLGPAVVMAGAFAFFLGVALMRD